MGISIWQLIILAGFLCIIAIGIWLNVRILNKAGYSGWWSITQFVPFVNIVMIWVFAFSNWPKLNKPTNVAKHNLKNTLITDTTNNNAISQNETRESNNIFHTVNPRSMNIDSVACTDTKQEPIIFKILSIILFTILVIFTIFYITNNQSTPFNYPTTQNGSYNNGALFRSKDINKLKQALIGHWRLVPTSGAASQFLIHFSTTIYSIILEDGSIITTKYHVANSDYPGNYLLLVLGESDSVSTLIHFNETGNKMRLILFAETVEAIFDDDKMEMEGTYDDFIKIDNKEKL